MGGEETESDKFIEFKLPAAKQLKRAVIYWEKPSTEMLVQYPDGAGWKTVATVTPGPGDRVSAVELAPTLPATDKVRFFQKLGKGPAYRPQLVWVREIEIY